jgi:RNA recognition motif-containing protein
MKIYVGNLSYRATDADLSEAFGPYGQVESARVIMDRETNRSRGFGFVEMPDAAGTAAIQALDGAMLQGRPLKVNEARPQTERPMNRDRRPPRGNYGGGRYE